MANNRMFLVYRPTGDAVYLGSHLGQKWHVPENVGEQLAALFEEAWPGPPGASQEDFCLAMEYADGNPLILENWRYPTSKEKEKHCDWCEEGAHDRTLRWLVMLPAKPKEEEE